MWINGSSVSGTTTEGGTVESGDNANACQDYIYIGDSDSDFNLKISDLAIYDVDLSSEGVPTSTEHYNSGKWFDHATFTSDGNSIAENVSYYAFEYSLDTVSDIYDVAPNTNNNTLNYNYDTTDISFVDRTNDNTFNQTNHKSLSTFIDDWDSHSPLL